MSSTNAWDILEKWALPVIGIALLVFGVIEIGVGLWIYNFLDNVKLGGWWAAICPLICGVIGVSTAFLSDASFGKGPVVLGCFFGVIGFIIVIVASFVDGIASTFFDNLDACYNKGTGQISGQFSSDGASDCLSYSDFSSTSAEADQTCFCATSGACFEYNLASSTDCNLMLTKYPSMLDVSAGFLTVLIFTMLLYLIMTCKMLCCASRSAMDNGGIVVMSPSPAAGVVIMTPSSMEMQKQPQQVVMGHTVVQQGTVVQGTVAPQPVVVVQAQVISYA